MGEATLDALHARLAAYDGRTTSELTAIAEDWSDDAGYCAALITLAGSDEGHVANGATWLIKAALEGEGAFSPAEIDQLIDTLPALMDWAAQLHVAQSLRLLDLPQARGQEIAEWLTPLLTHKRPFLRAWALDGMAHLARSLEGFDAEFTAALGAALEDDAASVRARARNLAGG